MKAAVLREIKQPLTIEDVEVSKPGAHEVLIRTAAAGVCHSDLHYQNGSYLWPMPTVLGHESAGVVEQGRPALCDKADTRRAPGDAPRLSQKGEPMHQFADLSSYAEQLLVHENAVVKITKDMPLDRAALIGCGVTTGVGAVFKTAKLPAGATVAVIGCGGVGLSAIQGARIAGAGQGRLNLDDLVSKRIRLDQVNEAFADLLRGTVARSVIVFD